MIGRVINQENVTLAVLAGGEGRRMGKPKADLHIGDIPILQYLLSQWQWNGPTLLVTAPEREHPAGYERFTAEVSDPVAGMGPLRGVLTALEKCGTELLVVATVDMPAMRTGQFEWLVQRLTERADSAGMMILRASHPLGRLEPFPCAFRRTDQTVEIVRRQLAGDDRSVHALADLPGIEAVRAPAEWADDLWINLNRPEDVQRFAERSENDGRISP